MCLVFIVLHTVADASSLGWISLEILKAVSTTLCHKMAIISNIDEASRKRQITQWRCRSTS